MRGFAHLHARAQQVIRHSKDWKLPVLCDRDQMENSVGGWVTLLGNAAHPTLQSKAQGAWKGLRGAALETYRRQCVLRTARIQRMFDAVGDHVFHSADVHAKLRNAIMTAESDAEWHDTLA